MRSTSTSLSYHIRSLRERGTDYLTVSHHFRCLLAAVAARERHHFLKFNEKRTANFQIK
ncbi:hypothetical protein [Methanimicrococcus stummii]|uniref:hypothetical protein n=1 Tax=Methanimicrococcus stummii TaxID=3028294 RepID=UPI00292F5804|nr:hypothetical protein [Methanimicrococcus sp. Es2]